MKKQKLLIFLSFVYFLPSLACAASLSIFPLSGDAGTNVTFNFLFLPDTNYEVITIKIYVPPCDQSGCSNIPYYYIDPSSISSSPPGLITTETYEGRISSINWTSLPQSQVSLFFNATLDTPPQDRVDSWLCFYKEKKGVSIREGNVSNYSSVLAPNLQVVELNVFPKEVILDSSNPQVEVYVNATVKNVRDLNHSGTSYGLNPFMLVSPEWLPSPSPSPFYVNSTLSKLLPDQALSAQWVLNAEYGETQSNSYTIKINFSDKNSYSSLAQENVSVITTQASQVCSKCYVKMKSCPSQVIAGSNFQITYEINSSDKYEIQAIFINGTRKECYFKEDYEQCSLQQKTRTISAPSTPGKYEVKVSCYASPIGASSYCVYEDSSDVCEINVKEEISKLFIFLQTDKSEYFKGEKILISGNVRDQQENVVPNAEVYISLSSGRWQFNYKTYTDNYGRFYYEYPISFGDPEGEWRISVRAIDSLGNVGDAELFIRVKVSEEVFSLKFISPLQDSTFKRGDTIRIEVEVTKANKSETNATVTCNFPNTLVIKLNETFAGNYSGNYTITFEDPIGTWSLVCQVTKEEKGKIYTGGSFTNVYVEPAKLELRLVSPKESELVSGETVFFTVEAYYPNGKPLKGGRLTLKFQGETLTLSEIKEGNYSSQFKVKDQGEFLARILAEDSSGNKGEIEKTFKVISPQLLFSSYWWLSLFSLPIPFYFVYKYFKGKISEEEKIKKEIENYKKELESIEEMQRVTQQEYFHRKIEEGTFKRMMEDFEKRAIEMQVKIKDLEARLEKLKNK
ncbi:MAG: hypothetical protein ACP5O8_00110 [Candidatus Aenigmatarchaeota archaeon]